MDRVSNLLAQFPGPLVLRPSKRKWFGLFATAGLFTVAGIGESIHSASVANCIGAAFFGLCTVAVGYMVFFANFTLVLDKDGFAWRGGRLSERWRWIDVGDFSVVEYAPAAPGASLRKRIGFNDKRAAKSRSQAMGELLSDAMTGRDCFIPDAYGASSFGVPMEDLVPLMSEWQQLALQMVRAEVATTVK